MRKENRILLTVLFALCASGLLWGCKKETPATTGEAPKATEAAQSEAAPETVSETEEPAETPAEKEYDITVPNFPFRRETFPRMDGSTAAVPLGKAIASALLGETMEETAGLCSFNRTTQSFRNLASGLCDILVVGEPNAAVYQEMEEAGFSYELEEIATDALIFVVNEANPVDSLTTEEIRGIYTGKITNWKEVGGEDAEIIPFQRNEGAGSQALIRKLVMKDTEMMEPPTELVAGSMGDLMTAVRDYDGSANALGYSVYYYASDMKMAKGLKILSVDGVEPSDRTIRERQYPHLNAYYCVIPSDPVKETEEEKMRAEGARVIYDWLGTEGGQNLVASMGYVSLMDVGEGKVNRETLPGDLYTLIDGKEPGAVTPREDYGKLIPYAGIPLFEDYGDGNTWQVGSYYGFFDENGRIASAPIYPYVEVLTRYDSRKQREEYVPMYALSEKQEGLETDEYGNVTDGFFMKKLMTVDGKFLSEKAYACIECFTDGIFCAEDFDYQHFDYIGYDGKTLFTDRIILEANPGMSQFIDDESPWYGFRPVGNYYSVGVGNETWLLDRKTLKTAVRIVGSVGEYSQGKFTVSDRPGYGENVRWGFLGDTFETLLPDGYEQIELLDNGGAVCLSRGKVTVMDPDLQTIAEMEGVSYITPTCYGFETQSSDPETGNVTRFYDFSGSLLYEDTDAAVSSAPDLPFITMPARMSDDGEAVLTDGTPTGCYVSNLVTEEQVFLLDVDSVFPFYTMEGTAPIPSLFAVRYGYEEGKEDAYYLLSRDLSEMYEAGCSVYAAADKLTGEWYIVTCDDWESDDYRILNADLEVVAEGLPSGAEIRDGLLLYEKDNAFIAEKPDGTVVFRYSLIKSMGD